MHVVRALPVDEAARPLARPTRRHGTVVRLPPGEETGTGCAHRRHVPLSTHIHINDTTTAPVSALVDTGASLSSINAGLLDRLGGKIAGRPVRVQGLGAVETLGWTTITFFIPARDSHGFSVNLECALDFHVLPLFAPGLLVGLDFIQGQEVTIDAPHGKAHIRRYAFDVVDHLPGPHARDAPLCSSEPVCLPA
ncbi:hypothetical protein CF336_g7909 [Tilletia laevis]|nr:hypothetical protein CF336_g7909 [Tilletia laevis]KAE8184839.1 hypothetical protein CF335_g7903 [Tilletia laevis]